MTVALLWCDADWFELFHIIDTVIYMVRKNTALLRCTANQVGTGHELNFQPRHQAWDQLAAINNKNGCGMAEVNFRKFMSVSYH